MPFEVHSTTAENIIDAIDTVLLKHSGCNTAFVADFLDLPQTAAENALKMGVQLGLIEFNSVPDIYVPKNPFATYLVTARVEQKSVVLRLYLEQFAPYKLFKERLTITNRTTVAGEQVRAFYSLLAHRDDITNCFINLGTYTKSIISKGGGSYVVKEVEDQRDYYKELNDIISNRERAVLYLTKYLTEETSTWINREDVFDQLVTAIQRLDNIDQDTRSPILYAGNAFESFLGQYGNHVGIVLGTFNGVNSKIDELSRQGAFNTKYKNICKYIGHIRNACDHGVDAEIGNTWTITKETCREFVHVVINSIKNIHGLTTNHFRI
ncbi:MAG: hypothetical protein ABSF81_17005 [Bacteroidales bacterium]